VTIDVATAGRPVESVAKVLAELAEAGHTYHATCSHDVGCPVTTAGVPLVYCNCEILTLTIREIRP
jgi:hypothetical protein